MNIHQVITITCRTDIVVIGHNPENADYTNPRGEIYGYRGYILATAPDGSRWEFNRTMTDRSERVVLERLESFVKHVQQHIDRGGKLNPAHWEESRPQYGSEAYEVGGWSRIDAENERAYDESNFT